VSLGTLSSLLSPTPWFDTGFPIEFGYSQPLRYRI
jgi:hypothetical protein